MKSTIQHVFLMSIFVDVIKQSAEKYVLNILSKKNNSKMKRTTQNI